MAKQSPIVIIGLIVVVALLMGGTILTGFSDLLGDLWDTWSDLWDIDDVTNGDNETSTLNPSNSFGYVGLEIHYKDGTVEDAKAESYSILPLSIMHSGKQISFIIARLYATMEYDGTITSSTAHIGFYAHIKGYTDKIFNIDETPSVTFTSGTEKELRSVTITEAQIDAACNGFSDGNYVLVFVSNVLIDATFDDGKTDSASYHAESEWSFGYSTSGITALSLRITTTPYYRS
mgnify:CR=1 FL=1